jgi:hypothetical protein
MSNSPDFRLSNAVLACAIGKMCTPSIDETYPKADEFLDVRDYLKDLAALVDAHILEVAKIAASNACHHGIDADLGKDVLINGLDGFLFYDLEQEAIGVRSAYQACHGPSAYDVARNRREAA